ncbi:hypothetical protein [Sphaerospermopsis aphanizomenoides]|nr:hypothetical protein [Sphaerospermopsis aphanizomenoides]
MANEEECINLHCGKILGGDKQSLNASEFLAFINIANTGHHLAHHL